MKRIVMITLLCASSLSAMPAAYEAMNNEIVPKVKRHRGHQAAQVLSGIIPLGLASAGAYEALSGNRPLGLGLIAGAGVAGLLRTYLLRRVIEKSLYRHHDKLMAFLKAWPLHREQAPVAVRAFMDRLHKQVVVEQNFTLNPEQATAITKVMQTMAVVEKAASVPLAHEYEKWQFVLEQVGLMNMPSASYGVAFGKRAPRGLLGMLGGAVWGPLLAIYLSLRVPKLRDYIRGFRHANLRGESYSYIERRQKKEREEISQEWPAKYLGWPNKQWQYDEDKSYFDDHGNRVQRIWRFGGAMVGAGAMVGFIHWLFKSGFMAYAVRKANDERFDRFVAAWPLVKHLVPAALHKRFDDLYLDAFNEETQEVSLPRAVRKKFLKQLWDDSKKWHKKIKGFGTVKRSLFKRMFSRGKLSKTQ